MFAGNLTRVPHKMATFSSVSCQITPVSPFKSCPRECMCLQVTQNITELFLCYIWIDTGCQRQCHERLSGYHDGVAGCQAAELGGKDGERRMLSVGQRYIVHLKVCEIIHSYISDLLTNVEITGYQASLSLPRHRGNSSEHLYTASQSEYNLYDINISRSIVGSPSSAKFVGLT